MKKSSKAIKREKRIAKREMLIIIFAFLISSVILIGLSLSYRKTVKANEASIAKLESLVEEESLRSEELKKAEQSMRSDDFIEKIARERLGLVSPGETILKPSE